MKYHKIAVIVWTIDPEGARRFLLRHNKPFDGYDDEWTIVFGNIDSGEDEQTAAVREMREEFGIADFLSVKGLDYTVEYTGKHGPTIAHLFAIRVPNIDVRVILNEESIGYDWVTLGRAKALMQHPDEFKALELL